MVAEVSFILSFVPKSILVVLPEKLNLSTSDYYFVIFKLEILSKKAIFKEKKTLYKYTGDIIKDIVLAPKVDSLNIVSNIKLLPVVSKPEINNNIEVFTNNNTKANIDEVSFPNINSNINPEEKTDNKRKWLIATGVILGAIGLATAILKKSLNAHKISLLKKEFLELDLMAQLNLKIS